MDGWAIEQVVTLILLDECGRRAYSPEGRIERIYAKPSADLVDSVLGLMLP